MGKVTNILIDNPVYKIPLNGVEYEILLETYEVNEKISEYTKKIDESSIFSDAESEEKAKKELICCIESIIGEGAVGRIAGGDKPKTEMLVRLLRIIKEYMTNAVQEYVVAEYGE